MEYDTLDVLSNNCLLHDNDHTSNIIVSLSAVFSEISTHNGNRVNIDSPDFVSITCFVCAKLSGSSSIVMLNCLEKERKKKKKK